MSGQAFEFIDWPHRLWTYLRNVEDLPAWISAISAAITTGVVVLTAVLALRGLWDARRTRHGQLITEIQREWTDPEIVESIRLQREYKAERIEKLVDAIFGRETEKASVREEDDWARLVLWANLIESMGVLCDEKALSARTIYKMWGGGVLEAWENWERAVKRLRVHDEAPDTFLYFEKLAHRIREIADREGGPPRRQSDASAAVREDRAAEAVEPDTR